MRAVCLECGRPESVCLCNAFETVPDVARNLKGELIVLQHPSERKRKLATVPILQKAVPGCVVLQGRRFPPRKFEQLDKAIEQAAIKHATIEHAALGRKLLVAFPGPGAVDITGAAPDDNQYTLLVIDGTWQYANEMFRDLSPRLLPPHGPGTLVKLPPRNDYSPPGARPAAEAAPVPSPAKSAPGCPPEARYSLAKEDEEGHAEGAGTVAGGSGGVVGIKRTAEEAAECSAPLLLRTEPMAGCVTTMEATVGCLAVLEGWSEEEQQATLAPLRALVHQQAQFNSSLQARMAGCGYVTSSKRATPRG